MRRQAHQNMPPLRFILYGGEDTSRQAPAGRVRPEYNVLHDDALAAADAAAILFDAHEGVLTETRRHIYLASLLGIRRVALARDHCDAAGFSRNIFERIEVDCSAYAQRFLCAGSIETVSRNRRCASRGPTRKMPACRISTRLDAGGCRRLAKSEGLSLSISGHTTRIASAIVGLRGTPMPPLLSPTA